MSERRAAGWAAACIGLGVALVLITIARTSITQDEPAFYSYGERVLSARHFSRILPNDNSKLPVAALQALPAALASGAGLHAAPLADWLPRWLTTPQEAAYVTSHLHLYGGRLVTLGFYVILCGGVFLWSREIYGLHAAVAATALTALLPTLLGHAALMTADAAATCTIFAAVYALARCYADPSLQAAVVAGALLGLAQLVKYTAVDLLPIAGLMLGARVLTAAPTESRWRVLHAGGAALVVAIVVAVAVINVGFVFDRTGVRLAELPCHSERCQAVAEWVGRIRLPLPYEYVHGLDLVALHDEAEVGGGNVYLLGALSRDGFASYYGVATLLKTPLPFLLLVILRPWRRHRRYTDVVLLAPVLWLFVHLSLFFHTQLGLRFLLPAFPFLAVLAAANWDERRSRTWRTIATGLLVLYGLGTVFQCPRYLAYFNALIGARRNAHHYLADSNLDWGQDEFALWTWQAAHVGQPYALTPSRPVTGLVVVRVNDLVGIDDPDAFRWLRARGEPIETIGDSYLVFDVSADGSPGQPR